MHPKASIDGALAQVQVQKDGCWIWMGYKKPVGKNLDGPFYGRYAQVYAHVYVYERLVGQVPPFKELDHLCRVTLCVNPSHLEPVEHRTNVLRGTGHTAKNAKKKACPKGHAYTQKNTRVYIHPRTGQKGRFCRLCEKERSALRRAG